MNVYSYILHKIVVVNLLTFLICFCHSTNRAYSKVFLCTLTAKIRWITYFFMTYKYCSKLTAISTSKNLYFFLIGFRLNYLHGFFNPN